jgi:hypothetical protein
LGIGLYRKVISTKDLKEMREYMIPYLQIILSGGNSKKGVPYMRMCFVSSRRSAAEGE